MNCEQARNELLPLAFESLEDESAQELRIHLSACPKCQGLENEVTDALSLLERPQLKAPERAWDKIRQRIHEEVSKQGAPKKISISVACTYCKGPLGRAESVFCGSCLAPHHPG